MAQMGWRMGAEPHASVVPPDLSLLLVKVSQGPPRVCSDLSQTLTRSGAPGSLA